jgi:hypothetical protein
MITHKTPIQRVTMLLPVISLICAAASVGYETSRAHRLTAELQSVKAEMHRLDPTDSADDDEVVVPIAGAAQGR